ncbi:MAG: carboxylesterase/lipase family protein [Dehalococcoidia bacterium]|nr:carboxylesterase/lipase family protein [Dehalococcoidia bacterium]
MPVAETTCGRLEGVQHEKHQSFMGIPFAAPPVGPLRFKAPQPPVVWSGVRKADTPGLASRQTGHPILGFAASGPQDEDCLYLNVFTPSADGGRRPVLFWIHGGGFTHGAGSEDLYNGGPLAVRGDVVVVTINYRLGALGYLWLGDHLPEAGLTANAGQLDQIAALEWVRDNIATFGGDPGNVTIFGESAGAAAVGTLLAMPGAKGLFHKAVLQSGTGRAGDRESGQRIADMLLAEVGLDRARAAELLTIPADRIIEAQSAVAAKVGQGGLVFGPIRDGVTLIDRPIDAVRAGAAAGIPVLAGTNRDEVKLFAATVRRDEMDDESLIRVVDATLGKPGPEKARSVVEVFRKSRAEKGLPGTNLDILDAVGSTARFRVGATRLVLAQQPHQPDTYLYLFTYASPARHGALGSCHALEMPFVFGTLGAPTQDRFAGSGPAVEQLSRQMMDAWLSFAKTGRPGHEGIGRWDAYTEPARPTMVFDLESGQQDDPFGEERRAVEGYV